jgi:hypothetical protein
MSWRKDVVEGRDVVEGKDVVEGGCSSRTLTLNVVCGPDRCLTQCSQQFNSIQFGASN